MEMRIGGPIKCAFTQVISRLLWSLIVGGLSRGEEMSLLGAMREGKGETNIPLSEQR